MKACVIGSPISHSLSPAIFAYISYHERKKIIYDAREVKLPELSAFLSDIRNDSDFKGMNVTIPLKETVLTEVDSLSEAASVIGAVNVVHSSQGQLKGHNTDVIGIEKTFSQVGYNLKEKVCILWGAGGSAKAVAFILGKHEARKVFIYNRSDRGSELAANYCRLYPKTSFISVSSLDQITDAVDVMINTTPLGMQGQESGRSYFEQAKSLTFSKNSLAFDLIYVPEETDFLTVCSELGMKTVGGLGMLIDQAIATWEIWIGPVSDHHKLHTGLKSYLRGVLKLRAMDKPLLLTGFMGAGKTTCGKKLSDVTKRKLIDTDQLITEREGKSVSEIFSTAGEARFRDLEKNAIKDSMAMSKTIVSLGGGALKSPENRSEILKNGILVYLKASPETLKSRVDNDKTDRPLLHGLSEDEKLDKITTLLTEREALYQSAHMSVDTTGKSAEEVCFELLTMIGARS